MTFARTTPGGSSPPSKARFPYRSKGMANRYRGGGTPYVRPARKRLLLPAPLHGKGKHRDRPPQPTLGMDRLDGILQTCAPHHPRDGQLARALRDRDDVDVNPGDGREDP